MQFETALSHMKHRVGWTEVWNTGVRIKQIVTEYWNHNKTWILSATVCHFSADTFILVPNWCNLV